MDESGNSRPEPGSTPVDKSVSIRRRFASSKRGRQQRAKLHACGRSISPRKQAPRPYQDVESSQLLLLAPKRFPDQALHIASIHGTTSDALAHDDAEARQRTPIAHCMDEKVLATRTARAQERVEYTSPRQARTAAKPFGCQQALYREPLATLGSTAVEDFPATQGLHAGAKSMCPCTAEFRGLIGTFHGTLKIGLVKNPLLHGAQTAVVNNP